MGYDNKNIDIIYFTDYKLSSKDIIQSIGRGTRICNNKYLRIILPTNFNNEVERNTIDRINVEVINNYFIINKKSFIKR